VKVYDVRRTPSDDKSSPGLWPGELKMRSFLFLVMVAIIDDVQGCQK
jgi:hypothetical protein